jgi:hypothetical protein
LCNPQNLLISWKNVHCLTSDFKTFYVSNVPFCFGQGWRGGKGGGRVLLC